MTIYLQSLSKQTTNISNTRFLAVETHLLTHLDIQQAVPSARYGNRQHQASAKSPAKMSIFAAFRTSPNEDLAKIGEEHMQKDLKPEDRALLRNAANKVTTHATVGSLLGLGLGIALAYRIRSNQVALYNAMKVVSRPTEVIFANGARGMFAFCPLQSQDIQ